MKQTWQGLEGMLLDSARGIRETVCYILRKHTDMDLLRYYVEHLETQYTNEAILGIGENGREEDARYISGYLQSDKAKTVCNTIKSLSYLSGWKADDIFWEYLLRDGRISVIKSAYQAIISTGNKHGSGVIFQEFSNCKNEHTKRYLILLLLREPSWDRLPYLLLLYHYEDMSLRIQIRRRANQRNDYGRITKEQAERIRGILYDKEKMIPSYLVKQIEFDLKYVTT